MYLEIKVNGIPGSSLATKIQVYDAAGRIPCEWIGTLYEGMNILKLTIPDLRAAIYFLRVSIPRGDGIRWMANGGVTGGMKARIYPKFVVW